MEFRELGKTGMKASVIGLGAEHLDKKEYDIVESTIHAAKAGGMNIMDLFMPGDTVREYIGKAIAGQREEWLIQGHIGSVDEDGQYGISRDLAVCKRQFERLLELLHTDYIDMGMLFFMDTMEAYDQVTQNGILDYARELKQAGTVRALGASAHNPAVALRLVEEDIVDMLLFSINPAFDRTLPQTDALSQLEKFQAMQMAAVDPERMKLYQLCESKGVGITVMKTLGAGQLLSAEMTPFKRPLTVAQCVHYALSRPAVTSALLGCATPEQVEEALRYFSLPAEELDYTDAISEMRKDAAGICMYCNHCQPCPSNIDIAAVNKYYDIAALNPASIPPGVASHYKTLDAHAGDCIACGECETRCPFAVPVIERMESAKNLFSY